MIKITILDEINAAIEGLPFDELTAVRDEYAFPVKGAHMQVAFQLGQWDGKESVVEIEDGVGYTYLYYMEQIIELLYDAFEYDEEDIEIVDNRPPLPEFSPDVVPVDYMEKEFGHPYRDHQRAIVNTAIRELCGVLDAATNAGKTLVCGSIAKYFQPWFKSITIVPTDYLLNQTEKEFKHLGLDCIAISSKIATNKRLQKIRDHKHIIITWRLLNNVLAYEEKHQDYAITGNQFVVMYDELHEFGDTVIEAFRNGLNMCPIRFGMSGTVPSKDKLKKAHIIGCIGNAEIENVSIRYLMDMEYASEANIMMYETEDEEIEEIATKEMAKEEKWVWEMERRYYHNDVRVEAIAEFVAELDPKNTLILCHPDLGWKLSELLDVPMIDKDMRTEDRTELFEQFDVKNDHMFCATFGTVGTGVSSNRIFRGIIIDVGKDDVNIRQGIGRLVRLDGEVNEVDVIDISARTYFAMNHKKDRKRIYKKHQYNFKDNCGTIVV